MLSDHRTGSFGEHYGTLIKELRIESRAIFVVDKNNKIRYVEYVKEVGDHPNYEAAMARRSKPYRRGNMDPRRIAAIRRCPIGARAGGLQKFWRKRAAFGNVVRWFVATGNFAALNQKTWIARTTLRVLSKICWFCDVAICVQVVSVSHVFAGAGTRHHDDRYLLQPEVGFNLRQYFAPAFSGQIQIKNDEIGARELAEQSLCKVVRCFDTVPGDDQSHIDRRVSCSASRIRRTSLGLSSTTRIRSGRTASSLAWTPPLAFKLGATVGHTVND